MFSSIAPERTAARWCFISWPIRDSLAGGGSMGISRRDFLGTAALGAIAAPLVSATGMPLRTLGSTGAQVSILAFGGGSRFVGYGPEKGPEVLNQALDMGITYIDTADAYGQNGESNIAVGKVLKARGRNGLWLPPTNNGAPPATFLVRPAAS